MSDLQASHRSGNRRTMRVVRNDRLVYFRQKADADYWDSHWDAERSDDYFSAAQQGKLDFSKTQAFLTHLPKHGRILEAGCGLGIVVLALRAHGYDVEGVEWGEKTVAFLNQRFPDLPVRVGDVTALKVPDDTYAGYISLGVVEHREAGPEPFLTEAFRVLQPGGVACISVPHFNSLRKIKAQLSMYTETVPTGLDFYQYAFSRQEFSHLIEAAGFKVIDWYGSNALKALRDEIPFVKWVSRNRLVYKVLWRTLNFSRFTEDRLGHMQMVVCVKPHG